ncbi:MAG: hypothetical protein C4527_03520, partial [Candidatus Omnitrophota bacterium]
MPCHKPDGKNLFRRRHGKRRNPQRIDYKSKRILILRHVDGIPSKPLPSHFIPFTICQPLPIKSMIQNMNKPSSKNNYQTGQLFDDVLFSADENDPAQRGKKITYRVRKLYEIPIERMQTDANQPRHFFDSQKLNNLAESILEKGVLQPVLFRVENGKPILVAG